MTARSLPGLGATWLGRIGYPASYALQREMLEQRKADEIGDTLLLLEHDHVYTLGRRSSDGDILATPEELASAGATVEETDRGGETTYHGPGQLVVYPIVSIRELKIGPVAYVRLLEEVTLQLLSAHGIRGHRVVGKTGVWVGGEPGGKVSAGAAPAGRKIAAIGVRVSSGVTMHGLSLNVDPDLTMYDWIVPCGMTGLDVTSMRAETDGDATVEAVAREWAESFAEILGYDLAFVEPEQFAAARNGIVAVSV